MKFWEAMKVLQEGKKITRKCWDDKKAYIRMDEFKNFKDENNAIQVMLYVEDDWEIYEEPKKYCDLFGNNRSCCEDDCEVMGQCFQIKNLKDELYELGIKMDINLK